MRQHAGTANSCGPDLSRQQKLPGSFGAKKPVFLQELESLASLHEADPEKLGQLKALYLYAQELVS
jgi:hypothetical protein